MLKHINDADEFSEAIEKGTVLVDFYATWCGPCSMLTPIIEKIAAEHTEIEVIKVDIDKGSELAAKYRISAVPTLMVFKDGKQVNHGMGYMPEANILRLLEAK